MKLYFIFKFLTGAKKRGKRERLLPVESDLDVFESVVMELPEVVIGVVIDVLEHIEKIKDPDLIANRVVAIDIEKTFNFSIGESGDIDNLTPSDVKEIGGIDRHGFPFTTGDGYRS
jgi:hypothetical protein